MNSYSSYVPDESDCYGFDDLVDLYDLGSMPNIDPDTGEKLYERSVLEKYAALPDNAFAIGYNF